MQENEKIFVAESWLENGPNNVLKSKFVGLKLVRF